MFEQTNVVSGGGNEDVSERLMVVDVNHMNSLTTGTETSVATTYSSLNGLNSGVPTQTTPTLTPTTLRSIEQYFMVDNMQHDGAPPVPHENEAGFVPPLVPMVSQPSTTYTTVDTKGWGVGTATVSSSPHNEYAPMRLTSSTTTSSMTVSSTTSTTSGRRNMGGRRPNNSEKLTPEEEEKRKLRRERNKLAAARCRKRRMDHTSLLENETANLEKKKQMIQNEIKMLQCEKEELEFILEAHKSTCKWKKSENAKNMYNEMYVKEEKGDHFSSAQHMEEVAGSFEISHALDNVTNCKPKPRPRPTSLAVPNLFSKPASTSAVEELNIPMSTPSAGMFNFESILEGGTGLTPVSTGLTPVTSSVPVTGGLVTPVVQNHCSVQQRSNNSEIASPEAPPPKLVSL